MEESKTKPIPLTESELLQLQTGMIDAIEKTDSKWARSPNATNVLYLKGANDSHVELNPDNSKTFPKSVLKTGSYGNGVQNSFSEPKFSLKGDLDFNESESWELRSKLNQKDFMSEDPLFKVVFCDWINLEGKGHRVDIAESSSIFIFGPYGHPSAVRENYLILLKYAILRAVFCVFMNKLKNNNIILPALKS